MLLMQFRRIWPFKPNWPNWIFIIFGLSQLPPKVWARQTRWAQMLGLSLKCNFYSVTFLVWFFQFLYIYFGFHEKFHFMAREMPRVINLLVGMLLFSFRGKTIVTSHLIRSDNKATIPKEKCRLRGERKGIKTKSLPLFLLFFCFHFLLSSFSFILFIKNSKIFQSS